MIPTQAGHDAGILSAAGIPTRDAVRAQPDGGLALARRARRGRRLPRRGRGARRRARRCWSRDARSGSSTPCWRTASHDDVLVEVDGGPDHRSGRRAPGHRRARPHRRAHRPGLTVPGHRPGPHRPGPGQLPLPRLPPRAAGAHAGRARVVLDLARADVRRRGRADPGLLLRPRPRRPTPRWGPPGSRRSGSSTTCTTSPTGRRTTTPTRWARRSLAAADEAGIRIRLLDTCYLAAGFGRAPEGVQVRYSDGDARRVGRAGGRASTTPRLGAAIHSVRAVPREQLATVVAAARGQPLHVHLSEQVAENEACLAATASRRPSCSPRPARSDR